MKDTLSFMEVFALLVGLLMVVCLFLAVASFVDFFTRGA